MSANSIHLPDLILICRPHFEFRANRHCRKATTLARKWVEAAGFLTEDEQKALPGLQVGLLASCCLPRCDVAQLQVATEFLTLLVHCNDSNCDLPPAFEQIWNRLTRETTFSWQTRFQENLHAFGIAQARRARDNGQEIAPDLESYIGMKRDSSGLLMGFDLIEYAEGLRIPDDVLESPILQSLKQDAHDIIAWTNDIVSYNAKQAMGDHHCLINVLMAEKAIPAQGAIQVATNLVKQKVDNFLSNESMLPSWGPAIDEEVRTYVQGLRDWIIGHVHWVYETDRYFQEGGNEVRSFGWVFLLPKHKAKEHC